jgi:hypothetical protein
MMPPAKEISVTKAALAGLAFGVIYSAGRAIYETRPVAETVGTIIGGAIGGAFLFALVAAVVNRFRK